jgi:hypothetical protein
MDTPLAKLALALAGGVARGDPDADALVVEGFNSVEEAARAHAYLSGFLLEMLAHARREPVLATLDFVRSKLDNA